MSLETWKKEFYPIDADKTEIQDAVDHSLAKWKGLRRENLERHGVWIHYDTLKDRADPHAEVVVIDSDSCSLCHHYYDVETDKNLTLDEMNSLTMEEIMSANCRKCPIYKARGGCCSTNLPCTDDTDTTDLAPWWWWKDKKNPEPMIAWLNKAQKYATPKV